MSSSNTPLDRNNLSEVDRMHMNMCIMHTAQQMNDPETCIAYYAARHFNEGKSDVTVGEIKQKCELFNNKLPVGFYEDLCYGQLEAYRSAFAAQRPGASAKTAPKSAPKLLPRRREEVTMEEEDVTATVSVPAEESPEETGRKVMEGLQRTGQVLGAMFGAGTGAAMGRDYSSSGNGTRYAQGNWARNNSSWGNQTGRRGY